MANTDKSPDDNFIQRIISAIFGSSDPEADKKRILKNIAKELSKSKYKFYKHNGKTAQPGLGKFFYEIYKVLGPAQVIFQSMTNPNSLKFAVIDFSLSEKQHQLAEQLTEETIITQSKTLSAKELAEQTKTTLSLFLSEFDTDKIESIDLLYNNINAFKALCSYDYYFMLKKFDSSLQERNYAAVPKLESINAEYILDDLKDFIAIAWTLPENANWELTIKLIKDLKGIEPVSLNIWNKIINRIKNLKDSRVLEMLIQCAAGDPSYEPYLENHNEHIVDDYINKIKTQTDLTLKQIDRQQTNLKVEQLVNQLFGTGAVVRLKGYTEQMSQTLLKKGLGEFRYQEPLNYLKAFLLDFIKKDIREYTDLVMIRGKWVSQALATPASEAYNTLLSISEKITAFDESYQESNEIGTKIKTLLPRTERDKDAASIIRTFIRDANEQAFNFLTKATQEMIILGKTIKNLIEDHDKPHPELLINWKEIDRIADPPINEQGKNVYKKIYLFATLMQNFLNNKY